MKRVHCIFRLVRECKCISFLFPFEWFLRFRVSPLISPGKRTDFRENHMGNYVYASHATFYGTHHNYLSFFFGRPRSTHKPEAIVNTYLHGDSLFFRCLLPYDTKILVVCRMRLDLDAVFHNPQAGRRKNQKKYGVKSLVNRLNRNSSRC